MIKYKIRWESRVARMEDCKNYFKILTAKPTGKRLLGMPRHRWEDNIIVDLK